MDKQDAIKCLKSMQQWIPDWDDREDGLSYWAAIDMAIAALSQPNEPLTIEQLREMDGEPVWIVDIGGLNWYGPGWAIVDRENNLVRTVKNWNAVFFEKYGERWLAYRRPPEGEEDT